MSFEAMLNHVCDIYHIQKTRASPGYGLLGSPKFSYPESPDEKNVKCHFCVKSGSRAIIQTEPQAKYQAQIKLVLPLDTDVRLNDKIVDKTTGYEYTADIPMRVQNHHLFVMIRRRSEQEAI